MDPKFPNQLQQVDKLILLTLEVYHTDYGDLGSQFSREGHSESFLGVRVDNGDVLRRTEGDGFADLLVEPAGEGVHVDVQSEDHAF